MTKKSMYSFFLVYYTSQIWDIIPCLISIWCDFTCIFASWNGMESNQSNTNTDFIISFFLPNGMIDWFEIVKMAEEPNTGKSRADILYDSILNIYLDNATTGRAIFWDWSPTVLRRLQSLRIIRYVIAKSCSMSDAGAIGMRTAETLSSINTPLTNEVRKCPWNSFFKDGPRQPAVNSDGFREILGVHSELRLLKN